jgi:hypothetical protein
VLGFELSRLYLAGERTELEEGGPRDGGAVGARARWRAGCTSRWRSGWVGSEIEGGVHLEMERPAAE